ncbi:MAG: N-acetyltransferase [Planctomycetes bacterium]|nr:N-acetyltransferase [Planctomycetota bacterium]
MAPGFNIIPVKDKKTLERFIKLPWAVYKDNPYWVPPLIDEAKKLFDRDIHPFHRHAEVELFLALNNADNPVGRIAAIVNYNHVNYHKEKTGFFGFLETVDSSEICKALLDAAGNYLKARGMEKMRGPASFSSNEQWGLLVEGFDSMPVVMMPYNPPYYEKLLANYGLAKSKDLFAYYVDESIKLPDKSARIAERIMSRKEIVIRNPDMKNFKSEIDIIKEIYNKAWQHNWGAIPLTDEEMDYMAKDFKTLLDPELLFIATVDGKPAGFSMAIPDYAPVLKKLNGKLSPLGIMKLVWYTKVKKIKRLRLITMGVVPEYQKRGIDVIFYMETVKRGLAKGYREAELSWVLEDNDLMNRTLQSFGARVYKKYRLYDISL